MFTVERVSDSGHHVLVAIFGDVELAKKFTETCADQILEGSKATDIDIHEYRVPARSLVRNVTDLKSSYHRMWDNNLKEWFEQDHDDDLSNLDRG